MLCGKHHMYLVHVLRIPYTHVSKYTRTVEPDPIDQSIDFILEANSAAAIRGNK